MRCRDRIGLFDCGGNWRTSRQLRAWGWLAAYRAMQCRRMTGETPGGLERKAQNKLGLVLVALKQSGGVDDLRRAPACIAYLGHNVNYEV